MEIQIRMHNGSIHTMKIESLGEIVGLFADGKVSKISFTLLDRRIGLYSDMEWVIY